MLLSYARGNGTDLMLTLLLQTKPHPSYYIVSSTGHTYGLLENPNDLFKKKVISMHMEEEYSQDTGQVSISEYATIIYVLFTQHNQKNY